MSLQRFFEDIVGRSLGDLARRDDPAADYLADLLTRFARTENLYPRGLRTRRLESVVESTRCSALGDGQTQIATVEHLLAALAGLKIDNALVVVFDTLQAFPAVILALALISLLGPSLRNVIIVIIVSFAPGYGRVSRALVLSVPIFAPS